MAASKRAVNLLTLLLPILLSLPQHTLALPTDSTAASSNTGKQVLAPVLTALGVSIVLACAVMIFRKRLSSWFKKHVGISTAATDGEVAGVGAEQTTQASTSTPSTTRPALGISEGDRPAGERRRRRRRRPSRASVVGLPLYSEDPNEEEMTLFKHRPSDVESREFHGDLLYGAGEEAGDSSSSLVRPSMDASSSDTHRGSIDIASTSTSMHRLSTPPSHANDSSSLSPDDTSEIIHLNALDPPVSSASSPNRPTHRSTISTPNATSSTLSIPMPAPGRNRASTFRSIFTRNESSSSVLPVGAGRSPYGRGSGGNSSTRLRSASSVSISSLSISAPLPHTLVSSSFVFPRAGLTPQQVSFISSRESLGAFGYGAGAEPPPAFDGEGPSRSETPTPSIHLSSPTRGRRSSSVSTQLSSPLRGGSNRSSPTSPAAPSHSPPLESSSPPREAESLSSDLSPAATSPSSGPPTLTPIDTSSRPLPAIFMLSATPTQSSVPSPTIPQADDDVDEGAPPTALYFQHASRTANFSTISEASFVSQATFSSVASPTDSDAASFTTATGGGGSD